MSRSIVEALLGTGAKCKVVRWLYLTRASDSPVPARALARLAKVPYGSIHKTLQELASDQLVVREDSVHGPLYRAPHDDPRLRGLFLLVRQDSAITEQLKRALRSLPGISYACLFGSFATGKTDRSSDIDVLVLEELGADRFAVMTALAKSGKKLCREIDGQFYSVDEFNVKVAEGDHVARSILAGTRIALKGSDPWVR